MLKFLFGHPLVRRLNAGGPEAAEVLWTAAEQSQPADVFRELLEKGARPSPPPPGHLPLLNALAIWYRERDAKSLVHLLVRDHGLDPNAVYTTVLGDELLPLGTALYAENIPMAKALVLEGADIEDPRLDAQVRNPRGKDLLVEMRARRRAANVARSRLAEEGIRQFAEREGLSPAVGPGIGVTFEKELIGPVKVQGPELSPDALAQNPNAKLRKGGRTTQKVRRHRKFTRRHRKSRT